LLKIKGVSEEHLDDVVEVAPDADEEHDEHEVLDPQVAARRAAALAHIRRFGDPVLKSRAARVDRFDDALRDQIDRMAALMNDALGIGLAAPQIGVSQQLLVYRVGPEGPLITLVNPEIEWTSDDAEGAEEGCLSIPGILVDVDRPVHVRVRAQDEHGDARVVEASGLEARVIQHEVDHLNGILIFDRTTKEQRKEALRAWRDAEREAA
jgi:peptide deformylase